MSKNERLTRGQRLTRHLLLPAAVLATAGAAIDAGVESGADSTLPTRTTVLLGKMTLNAGTNIHSSPTMAMSADLAPSPVSTNFVEKVPQGKSVVITDPKVKLETDSLGNVTAWYGYTSTSDGSQRWVDGTDIYEQQNQNGANYIDFQPSQANVTVDLLSPQNSGDEAIARLSNKTGQYELNGHPAAIGIEVPSIDSTANL